MKMRISIKDPDVLYDHLSDFYFDKKKDYMSQGFNEAKAMALAEIDKEEMTSFANMYAEYGEYFVIEFDTEAKTATVFSKYD